MLEGQTIGSLARTLGPRDGLGCWGLPRRVSTGWVVDVESAAEYFAAVATTLTDDDHASIRQRGLAIATDGPEMVITQLTARLVELRDLLTHVHEDRLVAVLPARRCVSTTTC